MDNTQRDAEICRLYKGNDKTPGATLEQLGERFNLSRERIRQIIRDAGITKFERTVPENNDDTFLGLYTTTEVKKALKEESKKKGVSVSSLSTKGIIDMLVGLGYKREDLTKKAVDRLVHE